MAAPKQVGLARGRKTRQIASPRSNQIIGSDIGDRASQIRRFASLGPCPVDIKSQVRHCPSDSSPEHLMLQQLVHALFGQWWPFLCRLPCPCSMWIRELQHIARPNETEEMLCGRREETFPSFGKCYKTQALSWFATQRETIPLQPARGCSSNEAAGSNRFPIRLFGLRRSPPSQNALLHPPSSSS